MLRGSIVISGWHSAYRAGADLAILVKGEPLQTVIRSVPRNDLAKAIGPEAADWGFAVHAVLTDPAHSADIGLRLPDGRVIERVQVAEARDISNPHEAFARFIKTVNATGGRVLEIGARARSAITRRELFSPSVDYIGFDVMAGENVDVVGDAHHLSRYVQEPCDYIFSISTFEHFLMPWKVALEMNAVLRPGGTVYSQSHQTWPVHDAPWDFFRFSREAWTGLFNVHTGFSVTEAIHGSPISMVSLFNPGGPFENMETSPGYGLSACIAVKTGAPKVSWDADVSDIQSIGYDH
ncbi:methyltransferase domain-containing protein [Brevundimonas sp. R86498]|uniref:methyltransferase domain-containing protein n=1 Tax=Brevundimonas sp. R86498 TaxID=3093845 RepID=UPI0037C97E95